MKKKYILRIILLLIVFFLQLSFRHLIEIQGAKPDLIILFLIYTAFRDDPYFAMSMGFLSGLLLGMVGPNIMGIDVISKVLLTYLVSKTHENLHKHNTIVIVIYIAAAMLFNDLVFSLLHYGIKIKLMNALYTVIIGTPIIKLMYYIFQESDQAIEDR